MGEGGATNAEATFSLNLDGNIGEKAGEDAAELEKLRQMIVGSTSDLRANSAAFRALRGSTDEVKQAKAQLKAKIDSERNAISAANLELLKQGTTYEHLAQDAKKLAAAKAKLAAKTEAEALAKTKAEAEGLRKTLDGVGGPLGELLGGFEKFTGIAGESGVAMGALVASAALVVAGIAAVTGALIAGAVAFTKWVVGAADVARSANLMREAATGSALNAHNLGTQVDELAGKLSTPKDKLNELAVELARSRLSGAAIVDTFNAVGRASDAMGDQVGKQLQDMITRGQRTRRLQIIPQELQGTGLKFQDIAGELAKQMHVGVKDAQAALFEGRVKLDDGAKAIRSAVEKRFGEVNAKKLISLDSLGVKFHETLAGLAKDVNLEPLLGGLASLGREFSASTVAGDALHKLTTIVGDGLVKSLAAGTPAAKQFLKGLVIGALDVTIGFLRLRNQLRATFSGDSLKGVDMLKVSLELAKAPLEALALVLESMAKSLQILGKVKGFVGLGGTDTKPAGAAMAAGVVQGVQAGTPAVAASMKALGEKSEAELRDTLKMHSPSRVYADMGRIGMAGGVVAGVRAGTPHVRRAAQDMVEPSAMGLGSRGFGGGIPMLGGRAGGGGGRAPITVTIQVDAKGNADGAGIAKQLSEPSFLAQLVSAIEDANAGQGFPNMSGPV